MNKTFIKDLPCCSRMSPNYVNALDGFLFRWMESLVPYYQEMKRKDASVFECVHVISPGSPCECYSSGGVDYWFADTALFGRTLALDGYKPHRNIDWKDWFRAEYHDILEVEDRYFTNEYAISRYFLRHHNITPKYDTLANRLANHFREITNDPTVIFALGQTSFICATPEAKRRLDYSLTLY